MAYLSSPRVSVRTRGTYGVHALRFPVRNPPTLTIQFEPNKMRISKWQNESYDTPKDIKQLVSCTNTTERLPSRSNRTAMRGDSDRKSIFGYLFLLAKAAIGWQAKKQTTVTQLRVEEEYAGMEYAE